MPIFSDDPDEDVELFLDLFRGYLAGLGIDPTDAVANPPGWKRSLGLLRGCLSGTAAEWFDQHLTDKNWELYNVFENHGQANWGALVGRTMPQLTGTGSFRAGSRMDAYARAGANVAVTLTQVLPPTGPDQNWEILGGRPTDRAVSVIGAGGGANPLVIQLRVNRAIYYFSTNYTTVLRERREVRLGILLKITILLGISIEKLLSMVDCWDSRIPLLKTNSLEVFHQIMGLNWIDLLGLIDR